MKCIEIIEYLEKQSPLKYASSWDNSGFLVGDSNKEIKKIFIALDATDEVIEEAVYQKVDMLLTHHPMIFQGMKRITSDDFIGRRIMQLIQNDIVCYAMHTNFDVKGMADLAAQCMGLHQTEVLEITYQDETGKEGFGRVGKLAAEMTLEECCQLVKDKFQIDSVKVFGELNQKIQKVAISPGSGKGMILAAIEKEVDVLITGDIDHHDGIDAVARKLNIIDAGHYGIEHIFIPYMKQYIETVLSDKVTVTCARIQSPFQII